MFHSWKKLWRSHYEELLRIIKSYIIDIWQVYKSMLYDSDTGLLKYQSWLGRVGVFQGKGTFGMLGGGEVMQGCLWCHLVFWVCYHLSIIIMNIIKNDIFIDLFSAIFTCLRSRGSYLCLEIWSYVEIKPSGSQLVENATKALY